MIAGGQAETSEESPPSAFRSLRFYWVAIAIVLVAAVVRILASLNGLWLDEIWSLELSRRMTSPLDVLLKLRHDNNHPLNTLLLHWIGESQPGGSGWAYRCPALLSGVASVVIAGSIAARRSALEACFALLLCGASALLIHYSSEARGYAPAIAFALLAFWLLDAKKEQAGVAHAIGFWLCVGLGLFSHLSFIYAYAAFAVWWFAEQRAAGVAWTDVLRRGLLWHGVPSATIALLYLLFVRELQIGGGPAVSFPGKIAGAASISLGMPLDGPLSWLGAALALGLFAAGLVLLRRSGSRRWIFYGLAVVGFPALALALTRPAYLAPRYFLVSSTFFLLLLAELAAAAYRHSRAGRLACAGALGLFLIANALHVEPLLRYGRGQYLEAMRFMSDTSDGPIRIGSDHDLRTGKVVRYYARYFSADRAPQFLGKDDWPEGGTDWFVLEYAVEERARRGRVPPRFFVDGRGHRYELKRGYPSAPLSGVDWFLYRNAGILAP
ncbi:MAG: hypothetical protein GY725_03480 [bacterium]|nr:hypothetical protein [bacterium]